MMQGKIPTKHSRNGCPGVMKGANRQLLYWRSTTMQTICTTIALPHPMLPVQSQSLWKNNLILALESTILKHTEVRQKQSEQQ